MAPRKAADNPTEPRRSSRIADKPKSPVGGRSAPKARAKKGSKKREAEGDDGEQNEKPLAKKVCLLKQMYSQKSIDIHICVVIYSQAKGSSEENGEELDELPDDDDDDVAGANLNIGDLIPPITLKNEKDEDVNVVELTADKGLVLFLVPKADTRQSSLQLGNTAFMMSSDFSNTKRFSWLHETSMRLPGLVSRFYKVQLQRVLCFGRHR